MEIILNQQKEILNMLDKILNMLAPRAFQSQFQTVHGQRSTEVEVFEDPKDDSPALGHIEDGTVPKQTGDCLSCPFGVPNADRCSSFIPSIQKTDGRNVPLDLCSRHYDSAWVHPEFFLPEVNGIISLSLTGSRPFGFSTYQYGPSLHAHVVVFFSTRSLVLQLVYLVWRYITTMPLVAMIQVQVLVLLPFPLALFSTVMPLSCRSCHGPLPLVLQSALNSLHSFRYCLRNGRWMFLPREGEGEKGDVTGYL